MEQSSRAERKTKRRKTNRILNTAIAVVVLLIVIVGFTIFAGGNDEETAAPETAPETKQDQSTAVSDEETEKEQAADTTEEPAETEEPVEEKEPSETEKESADEEKEVVVSEGTEPNVEKEIVDPNWEGVGTTQSGAHTSSFEMDSTDWEEKEQALAYATGIPQEDMTVWYISGNGPQGAIGTVSPKSNQDEAYRVYIEWVDGEGWKPTKVQELEENDKGR
ncbi:YrrS family protein [Domibacillus robiginosus]|uniref:YrrS family protein n=1 Tax=Domibacillus robiginosus TaxID=1071054 RepID=UPI00067D52BA|nr:YrrS family protein [Domibacillus robiginosus]